MNSPPPRLAHVDGIDELRIIFFGKLAFGFGDSLREGNGMAGGRQSRLENHQLLQCDSFPDDNWIIDRQGREILRLEPCARQRMFLGEDDHGMQPGLLEGGSEEKGRVETG